MLDKLKRTFSTGGVKVKLTPPRVITSGDTTLLITVALTNRAKEDRTVEDILLELREKPAPGAEDVPSHRGDGIQHLMDEAITIEPGQTRELTVDMPTTAAQAAAAAGVELPGWMKTASSALGAMQPRLREYEIRATTRVQGFGVSKTVTSDLGRGFAFG